MASMLVAVDTAWGTRFGGINAFNSELLKSLGVQPERNFEVCCVLPQVTPEDVATALKSCHVRLVDLHCEHAQFGETAVADIATALGMTDFTDVIWLGHDDKTGPLALQLRDAHGGRAALVHHMAYGAYQAYKKGNSQTAEAKKEGQRQLFRRANFCLAVGPRLTKELRQLLSTEKQPMAVAMLVPGLDDPAAYDVHYPATPPDYFSGFAAGRLGSEDDRIKQGRLALHAFAESVRQARNDNLSPALLDGPRMCLMGVAADQEQTLRADMESWADAHLQVSLLPFTEDRAAYYRTLAGSSFAMMLSWHEGFGLTGWEAIAARVPLILGRNSGLYELLRDEFQGQGEGHCLHPLTIRGHLPQAKTEENHQPEDVEAVTKAIRALATDPTDAKKAAIRLRETIARDGWDWGRTARDFIGALGLPMRRIPDAIPAADPAPAAPQPVTDDLPDWLKLPAKPAWDPRWGLSPVMLLQAAASVVPFDPARQPLLDGLLAWVEATDYPIKLRTYTGPGGTGKTRLALEAARSLQSQGWQCHWLRDDKPQDWPQLWRHTLAGERPTLVVLDYAETRGEEIRALLEQGLRCLETGGSAPLRVLLLARAAGEWWVDLCRQGAAAMLLKGPATWPPELIEPLGQDGSTREASYRAAVQAFAAATGRPPTAAYYLPPLEQGIYARPLYIQLAALAALAGQRPASAEALLEEQINREWRYWRHGPAAARQIPFADWSDALALLALAGGCPSVADGAAWLEKLGLPQAAVLAATLAERYPGTPGIAPLQPDLLAEWLLRCRLGEKRGRELAASALDLAPQSTLVVVGRLCVEGGGSLPECVQIILVQALADAWPSLGQLVVDVAQASAPSVSASLGNLLARTWPSLPMVAQRRLAIELRIPEDSTCLQDLMILVFRIRSTLTDQADEYRITALIRLRLALTRLDSSAAHEEALACAGEEAVIRRRQAESQPAAYLLNVPMSLNNLANHLSEQGEAESHSEALARARKSVTVCRNIAAMQPAVYLPDVAMSLNNLANHLSEQGDAKSRREALACARESLAIYRRLAEFQPAANLPNVATSLSNLANRLSEQGDAESRSEALACARESLAIRRRLAESQPAAYLPDVAMSLNNLANRLSEQGDAESRSEALACARDSVTIYRRLAESQAAAYLPDVAMSLNNLANRLSEQGGVESRNEALACAWESLAIHQRLAESQPAAHLSDVAMSLNNLANHLSEQGDAESRSEVLTCARGAASVYRRLAELRPAAYLPYVAASLNNLANHLSKQGDAESRSEALACARESVTVYARLYAAMPSAFSRNLGTACRTLERLAVASGLDGEAVVKAVLEQVGKAPDKEKISRGRRRFSPSLCRSATLLRAKPRRPPSCPNSSTPFHSATSRPATAFSSRRCAPTRRSTGT